MKSPTRHALFAVLVVLLIISGFQRYQAMARRNAARVDRPLGDDGLRIRTDQDRTLLWARDGIPDAEWFDVTDSAIDPRLFQYGIGKDTIASIDGPRFVSPDDPLVAEFGISDTSRVIGYAHAGEARAYPLAIMDRHELVNDRVGGRPVTVGW